MREFSANLSWSPARRYVFCIEKCEGDMEEDGEDDDESEGMEVEASEGEAKVCSLH